MLVDLFDKPFLAGVEQGLQRAPRRGRLKGLYPRRVGSNADELKLLPILCILIIVSCVQGPVSRSAQSLGTVVVITLYDRIKPRYFRESFAIADEIYRLMNREEEDSDLVRLREAAGNEAVGISSHTFTVLDAALEVAEHSAGAFTPLIEPLVNLWDIGGANPRVPADAEIASALSTMQRKNLQIIPSDHLPEHLPEHPHRVFLTEEGMGVDLGGIAKGYAADRVAEYLRSQGVEQAILDFGGNIVTIGAKGESLPWIIGIQRPGGERGTYLGTLPSVSTSIVTAGVYERYFTENGRRYHHILDPASGYPAEQNVDAVVVVAEESMTADAWSTALFVLGQKAGSDLVESLEDIEAVFIGSDKSIYLSSGLRDIFTLLDDDYRIAPLSTENDGN